MTRNRPPTSLPRPAYGPDGRAEAWAYRDTFRAARTWSEAMHLAMARASRDVPDAHVTVTPSHTTPTGRLSVKVFVRRCEPVTCRYCEAYA